VKQEYHLAEFSNPSISDKSFFVSLSYINDAREQERSRTDLGVFNSGNLLLLFHFGYASTMFLNQFLRVNLASKFKKLIQPSVYEECHTNRSFGFFQQTISLQLSGTSQRPCLHCPFQLFFCVGNLGNFQQAVSFFALNSSQRILNLA
jgi:hypothetical protein